MPLAVRAEASGERLEVVPNKVVRPDTATPAGRPAEMAKRALHRDPFTGTIFVFGAKQAGRLKLIFRDGTRLVMIRKRPERQGFARPPMCDGTASPDHARLEALFAAPDRRRVRVLSVRHPAEAE